MNRVLIHIVVMFCVSVAAQVQAHPAHVTLAEAEWNAASETLEIALQVRPYDLEQALSRMTRQAIDLDKSKDVDELIQVYLQRAITFSRADKNAAFRWVGKEVNARDVWLYFEVHLTDRGDGWRMRNVVFFDTLPQQVNTVTFRHGQRRRSLSFSEAHPTHLIPTP